ncbi:MAG: hypothetical protein HYZ11_07545 [Candidatus Tectomicrobia bacterium]|uniref:Sodium/calcium exchanger membrane region domain-containing protein n=1 Tax=Tectimicrobiota bacterium TaxID=2528274 RepID=A0A932I0B7_UNCTE|nr:hypothetical protein [Candidatus Tectomicrobia bacterium]
MKKAPLWVWSLFLGILLAAVLALLPGHTVMASPWTFGLLYLLGGVALINAASESLVHASEILSSRRNWNHFVGGTVGEIISTLPEIVVIIFVVPIDPVAAFLIAVITIYNNAVIFSIYSFFLPKTAGDGLYALPSPIFKIGREILIVGSAVALIFGFFLVASRLNVPPKQSLAGYEIIVIGVTMLFIFALYLHSLIAHYSVNEVHEALRPEERGHEPPSRMLLLFALGTGAAFFGGHMVSTFAEKMLHQIHLSPVRAALVLAFFAGIAEIFILVDSHRKGDYEIALSNAFGGITQVKFLVFPFTLLIIGLMQWLGDVPQGFVGIPIDNTVTLIMMMLFPVFFVLFELMQDGHTLSNFDAAAMFGLFVLILYFLAVYG